MHRSHQTEDKKDILSKTGIAVFANCEKSAVESWRVVVLTPIGEFDPDTIVEGNLIFVKEYRLKMKTMPILEVSEELIISAMLSIWVY
jgi:hypothetical protein